MPESKGIHPQGGTLVDGTFVEVSRQHNTKAENAQLKKGEIPEEFKSNPHRLAQKECDGNWTKKGNAAFFGYKNHPWVDAFWELMWGYAPQICEKGYRNHLLTEEQKESNCLKSKVRCRIEHIFGEQKMRMRDET
ncbi:hypothetical protein FACS189454_03990 [Planctomycetales bacterium]|nr:hypothetical protein FACS189454_03990 [Planctomycetales bacterium]